MKRYFTALLALLTVAVLPLAAEDLVGTGRGGTREEARAYAVQDIKSQIMVEQQSTTTLRSHEQSGKGRDSSYESLDVLITEYSRELPLEGIEYDDREDRSASYGENWFVTARIPSSMARVYMEKMDRLGEEIVLINEKIENDRQKVKNASWTKTLLDLSYDYISYTAIVNRLDPGIKVPGLPISIARVKLEYEDSIMREKNQLETEIASLSLLFADGVLDSDELSRLDDSRDRYAVLSEAMDELNGNTRDSREYRFMDYTDMNPKTASDYLRRIEANRQAFAYYRSGPYDMEKKLVQLSRQAMADLDSISETMFRANSGDSDELSFEVLNWNDLNEGWVGRATIVLGDTTLQVSFLIPFEKLTGTSYNETTYNRWNKELMRHPEDVIELDIGYTVKGSFIGNSYEFTVRELSLLKADGEVFHRASIKNPSPIPFSYGTDVDLGDVGSSRAGKDLRAKANTETKSSRKIGFYVNAEAGGKAGLPFIFGDIDRETYEDDMSFSYSGMAGAEFGLRLTNGEEGRAKRLYGGGIKASINLFDTLDSTLYGVRTVTTVPFQYEVAAAGYYMWPTDGTLERFAKVYGSAGAGLGGEKIYFVLDGGAAILFNLQENLLFQAGATLRLTYGSYFEAAVKPTIGVEYVF